MSRATLVQLISPFLFTLLVFSTPSLSSPSASPPIFTDKVIVEDVRVAMRDGVELAVRILRPDAPGKFPGIMTYYPYRMLQPVKGDYTNVAKSMYAPYAPYLAERGYAIVQFDVRGTGNSGGWSKDIYSEMERRDAYEMVAWIAAQPWTNGKVGMVGKSYGGVVQWQTAVQNPPSLKAIIVRSANDSVYTEWTYPGGSLRPYMFDTFSPMMTARAFLPPDPEMVGEQWTDLWKERLENNEPWGLGYISNQVENKYWLDRSLSADYSRVRAATLVMEGWADVYATPILRAYSKIGAPKKAFIGPWEHRWEFMEGTVPGPRVDTLPIWLRWFDYWLKGIDNGVMDEPPVTLFVRGYTPPSVEMPLEDPGFWRHERDWPIPRVENTEFYFHSNGELNRNAPSNTVDQSSPLQYRASVGLTSGIFWGGGIQPFGMPLDQRLDEAYSLVYTTPPLERDVEVTGHPKAILHVSSSADVAYFRVKLIDVAPDGTSKLVRWGGINAAHRTSHSTPEALMPDQIYEVEVDIDALSYVFQKGHRIRVAIANADFQNAWPTAKSATNLVHYGPLLASRIVLPIIPTVEEGLGRPELILLPAANPQEYESRRPARYSIEQNLLDDTVTVYLARSLRLSSRGTGTAGSESESSFTVSNETPADANLLATWTEHMRRPGMVIKSTATESLRSDEISFHFISTVEVTVNGALYFNRSWTKTVPRLLN